MNLRQIELALAVAEEENFTRAAQRCHIVQSALSHQVARLEETLGAQLFERGARRTRLTPAGQVFVPAARRLLHEAQRLKEEVAAVGGQVRGTLSVGVISALTVLEPVDLLADFHQRHRQVDVRLQMGMSETMMADVREHRLDIAFVGLWPDERIEGLQSRLLEEEALVAVVWQGHPLARLGEVCLAQLAAEPLVDYYTGSGARRQTDEAFRAAGYDRHVHFEVGHVDLLARIVRRQLAIGLVPARTAPGLGGLAILPVRDAPSRRVYCTWSRHPTPAAMAFLELALARFPG
ncbi:LysR family transcriptional regulator [Chitiniphilus shinanonensis]|uniref:LysR family transcriptional regulator n=2 Tax=Chitiniphilus shinanonensis TaxID=553088 RepID=A0ABQ6BRT3_9NEIS|nr:LysR family transcriptional regulator [Chitiniphilus shinanonensis]GLS04036.1 LysR family transcriptional regulator [Chitiniphilus shinanonensis]